MKVENKLNPQGPATKPQIEFLLEGLPDDGKAWARAQIARFRELCLAIPYGIIVSEAESRFLCGE